MIPFNSLPNDKILDWSISKGYADDKKILNQKLNFDMEKVENIVGKGENAGCQHFLLFPQCFQKASFSGSLKLGLCSKELKPFITFQPKNQNSNCYCSKRS